MKKVSAIIPVFFFLFLFASNASADDRLVGEWTGSIEGDSLIFVFYPDMTMKFGSADAMFSGTYAVDYSTTPISLDITLILGEMSDTSYTVIEFIDDSHVRMEEPDSERPADFSNNPIVFERTGDAVVQETTE